MRRLLCAALLLTLVSSPALAEKWTDSSGQHVVEADFVSYQGGVVKLRLSDGRVVDVPLGKLNAAARARVKELVTHKAAPPKHTVSPRPKKASNAHAGLISQVKTTAKARRRDGFKISRDGKKTPSTALIVDVDFLGAPAADAREYGFLVIDSATGDGAAIERREQPASFDISQNFERIGSFEYKHLENGCRLPIEFRGSEPLPKSISIEGSLKLKTGGTKSKVIVKDLAKKSGPLVTPELRAAGLDVVISIAKAGGPNGQDLRVVITGEVGNLDGFQLTDNTGQELKGISFGHSIDSSSHEYHSEFEDGIPGNAQMGISIRLNPVDVTIPFKFDSLPVE